MPESSLLLAVPGPSLTPRVADDLLPGFLQQVHQAPADRPVEIDLGESAFFTPYGLVLLCLLGRYVRTFCNQVSFRPPRSAPVRRYLGRMGFAAGLAGIAETPGLAAERDWPQSEALLELTRIEAQADVERLLAMIASRVGGLLAAELHYTPLEINRFTNVVAELCHNILDHSLNWGYVAAQRYQDPRTGAKYAVIGVGDLGIGIKKSLGQRYDAGAWTHAEAIRNALKKACSRDPDRGLGLYVVERTCRRYGGSLHVKSGDTRVLVRGRRYTDYLSAFFPGTLLSISLCQRPG